jgi:hypothetical protein
MTSAKLHSASVGEEVSTINAECRRVNPQFKGEFVRFAVDRARGVWVSRGTIVVPIAEYRLPRQAKSAWRAAGSTPVLETTRPGRCGPGKSGPEPGGSNARAFS